MLFSQLKPKEAGKRDWLVSPKDELLRFPFAALRTGISATHNPFYLAELHSVQIVSGPLVPAAPAHPALESRFLTVGDPIYNIADPRWRGSRSFSTSTYETQLNRLPGSGQEVDVSATVWRDPVVLKGASTTKDQFLKELGSQPNVIHLATHAFTAGRTGEMFLAFGVGGNGEPELMGAADVAMPRVPGELVAMTGCETAGGDMRSGVELENLARAWTLAGVAAVLATLWPMEDSDGEFLAKFFLHLHDDGPAEALKKAHAALIHSRTPASVWASYQVYSGQT